MTTDHPYKTHKPAMVLIDVENTFGTLAQRSVAVTRLAALLEHVPAQARLVAACAPARIRPEVKQALADQGVRVLSAGTGPNAADKVLLNRARQAAANGVTHFTVVSADAAFADLAMLGDLHVVAFDRQPVGKALAKAATVHRIPRGRRASASAPGQPAEAPAIPRPAAAHPQPPAPTPDASPSPPQDSPPLLRWGAAATAALFCGGLAFGAGTALGNRLVHLTLDTATRRRP
ncbi:hypothetical protein [Streptomyces californicus]|uniref:hypothetical protein n=1 Tax=Streptomyces californicus TaxID=67351 RepID=UPI0033F6E8DE